MKIVTVVGARPQFIKAAALSRVLRKEHTEILVHTGQHHDENMSDIFFRELDIPRPDYNLGIAGGTHAQMTGRMLMAIEDVLIKEKPDFALVYGDTNSTLAAALAAVKLRVPLAHVEAGNRLGSLSNPEEVNRIMTDHAATLLFACVDSSVEFLRREGLTKGVHLVGNPMYDAFTYYSQKKADFSDVRDLSGAPVRVPEKYYYLTCHRQENTGTDEALHQILSAMDSLDAPTIYPVHPRNHATAQRLKARYGFPNVRFIQPVGYLSSIALSGHAERVVTDSGGVQCEAFYAGVPCVTVLDYVPWPETMVGNRNQLSRPDQRDILQKLSARQEIDPAYTPFGDGHACEKIVSILSKYAAGEDLKP